MLPDKLKVENSTKSLNKSEEYFYYDYNEDYDDDYDNYDETSPEPNKKQISTSSKPTTYKTEKSKSLEMKPIKEDNKPFKAPKLSFAHDIIQSSELDNNETNKIDAKSVKDLDDYKDDDNDDDDNDDDDDDDENDEDDIADENIIYSENVPCPRYCVCARNRNSFLVATCSR